MKTKAIVILVLSAIVTLSFTFSSASKKTEVKENATQQTQNEPAGGFVSEDKL
jgi:hypothetical protein